MATLANTHSQTVSKPHTGSLQARYEVFIKKMEFSHFGIIAIAILIGSCLGGITTMQIFEHDAPMWQFVLSLGITMANLVACISQAPTKWVINLFVACIAINAALLISNLI